MNVDEAVEDEMHLADIEDSKECFAGPVTLKEQEIDKYEESEDRNDFKYYVWPDKM